MTIDQATAKMLFEQNCLRELLQVPANAHGKELEKACKLARARHHPDKGGSHDLACVIDAAITKLLDDVSKGNAYESTYSWRGTYMGRPIFASNPKYEAKLRRECEMLESRLQKAKECMEMCGNGCHRPPCDETCDCHCTGHNAQRLRDQVESLAILMPRVEDALREASNASKVCNDEELNLMSRFARIANKSERY